MEIQNDAGKLVKNTRTEICGKQEAGRICQSWQVPVYSQTHLISNQWSAFTCKLH